MTSLHTMIVLSTSNNQPFTCPKCGTRILADTVECPICGVSLMKKRYWCWTCLRWIQGSGYLSYIYGGANDGGGHIRWQVVNGKQIPYCLFCDKPLIRQMKWTVIKNWIKYPLIIAVIIMSLWILMKLLGRDVLLIG